MSCKDKCPQCGATCLFGSYHQRVNHRCSNQHIWQEQKENQPTPSERINTLLADGNYYVRHGDNPLFDFFDAVFGVTSYHFRVYRKRKILGTKLPFFGEQVVDYQSDGTIILRCAVTDPAWMWITRG